jgi:sugar lactone lactonase YvrE
MLLFSVLTLASASHFESNLLHGFKFLNFTFESAADAESYITNRNYTNCLLAGIKMNSKGTTFVSVPRWKDNVPATLSTLDESTTPPLLRPFPSWEGNQAYVSSALQSVLGFEIDPDDNIWVLDQGRVNSVPVAGSTKLNKYNSQTGELLESFNMSSVADPASTFLNDVVIDTENHFAYIADSGINANSSLPTQGSLYTINLKTKEIRRVLFNTASTNPDPSTWVVVNGNRTNSDKPMSTGADGIALTCDFETLFFTPLTSRTLYSIKTKYLRDTDLTAEQLLDKVQDLGFKTSASDGLAAGAGGHLYFTGIETNTVYRQFSNVDKPVEMFYKRLETIAQDDEEMMWPDTIGFNNQDKSLLFVANQLQNFEAGLIDFEEPKYGKYNYYIWEVEVDERSYVGGCEDSDYSDNKDSTPSWVVPLIVGVCAAIGVAAVTWCIYKRHRAKTHKKPLIPTS